MADRAPLSPASTLRRLAAIAVIVGGVAGAFAYTGGWLAPDRVTPAQLVDTLKPPGGAVAGYRRNHAKGVCFTGTLRSNGAAAALSTASVWSRGEYPVIGRFNLAGPDPRMPDPAGRVRGLSLAIRTPDHQEWRTAMIDAPVFAAATPQDFYELQRVMARKAVDPDGVKRYAAAHPAFVAFAAWAGSAPFTASWAEDRFNGLDAFELVDAAGHAQAVRWSFVPAATPEAIPPAELKQRAPDFLQQDIAARVAAAPPTWTLVLTLADPGDPTADPSRAWPAQRRVVEAATLVASRIEPEADGPCRDLNFDPTVLPPGMRTSDDPFPAARSAAYAVSYDRRTAEAAAYPHAPAGSQP